MNYGSVCSGVEAATLAWAPLGWKAVFFAEVEPFPAAVLQQRFGATRPLRLLPPAEAGSEKERKERESWQKQAAELPEGGAIPNLGDFTRITKEDYNEPIDLLVGGTPCQDLSCAGRHAGLAGARSGLALDFIRLAYELGCRWVVWENVPNALSSNGSRDFATLLSLLSGREVGVPPGGRWGTAGFVCNARKDRFGLAWRVLDAQYTRVPEFPRAVPQRRRRLFLVGYLGSWVYPATVLFDREMCGGYTPPCRTKGENATARTEDGAGASGEVIEAEWWDGGTEAGTLTVTSNNQLMPDKGRLQCVVERNVECVDSRQVEAQEVELAPTLIATDYKGGKCVYKSEPICFENHGNDSRIRGVTVSPTITSRAGTGGGNLPLVQEKDVAPTLMASMYGKNTFEDCDKFMIEGKPIGFIKNDAGGEQQGFWGDMFPTLRSGALPAVAYNVTFCDANGRRKDRPNGGLYVTEADTGKTVTANGPNTEMVVVDSVAIAENIIGRQDHTGGNGVGAQEELAYTQNATGVMGVATMEHVSNPRIWTIDADRSNSMKSPNPNSGIHEADVAKTLDTTIPTPQKAQGGQMIVDAVECVPLDLRNATRDPNKKDEQNRQGVGVGEDGAPMNTLTVASVPGVGWQATVRRLLPVECERLMGFPDNHTRISWKGKPEEECPDAPRYKACGNSMCVNVMAWIGHRIQAVEESLASRDAKPPSDASVTCHENAAEKTVQPQT